MPNTITEQQEQELYSNAYKLGHVFVKSIRYDHKDFWADFLVGVLEDKYVKLGMPLDKIRVPLRKGDPKDFKVTKDGAVKTDNYQQYTPEEKQGFSKKQSVSVVSINKQYYPPVFGHDKDRHEELVGVMFFSDKIEKNSKSSHVLPSIIMLHDGGTSGRPYHFDLLEKAEEYFKNKTQEKIWHDSVQLLIDTGKISNKNLKRYNEVLARLKWTGESNCQIGIFSDNLKSRLIAQLRAIDVKNNTEQEFVPISFYIPNSESKEKFYPYYLKDQAKDLELALLDPALNYRSEERKAIALYIYFLKLNNNGNNQQAYNYLTNVLNNVSLEFDFRSLLFYSSRKKITEISRKIVLNNIRETIYRNNQGVMDVDSKPQKEFLLLSAIDLEDTSKIDDLVEFEDEIGNNALHLAVKWGKVKFVKQLLDCAKIDCNKPDNEYNRTPLWMAVNAKNIEIIKLLLEVPNIDCNKANKNDETPLFTAIENGDIEIIKQLLEVPNIDCNKANRKLVTPLWAAIKDNNETIINLLSSNTNINWNEVNDRGETLIFRAVNSSIVSMKTVKLLLSNPKIDWTADNIPEMLLRRAINECETEVVKLLLSVKNIDFNKTDRYGYTPILKAILYGNIEIVKLMLEKVYFNTSNNGKPLDLEMLIEKANFKLQDFPEKRRKAMNDLLAEYKTNQQHHNIQSKSPTLKPRM